MTSLAQGLLIAMEGIDGSGKTTLAINLAKSLEQEGFPVRLTKEPGGTPVGQQLRTILQHQDQPLNHIAEYLLFAADRAQHFETIVLPSLAKKYIVISDRMADSSLVYQGYGRGLDKSMIKSINDWAMRGKHPDIVFYVRISPEQAIERLKKRAAKLTSFEQEKEDFTHRIMQGFDAVFKDRQNVIWLDGMKSQTELTQDALTMVKKWIQQHAQ